MNEKVWRGWTAIGLTALLWPGVSQAQMHHHHPVPADTTAQHHPKSSAHSHEAMGHEGMDMSTMDMREMAMTGMYGPYAMTREASGTGWQPEAARHQGVHIMRGAWMGMLHGSADLVFDHQGGERGDEKYFADNMLMGMAQRPLGPGSFGLRSMLSLEPLTIGKRGYPLLLQTGETADGVPR